MSPGLSPALERAIRLHQAREFERAEEEYRRVLDTHGRNWQALNGLGTCLAQRGATEAAILVLRDAVREAPAPSQAAMPLANLGNALQDAGRLEEALQAIDAALFALPANPDLLSNRGNVLRQLGRAQEALVCYERALAMAPRHARARVARGSARESLGLLSAALDDFDAAVQSYPEDAAAHWNRGVLLRRLQRFGESRTALARAIALAPLHADAYFQLGLTCSALRQWDEALTAFDKALSLRPDLPGIDEARGTALLALERYGAALECLERARRSCPDDVPLQLAHANALRCLGRHAEAAHAYERALAQAADPGRVLDTAMHAAYCRLFIGEREAALEHLRVCEDALAAGSGEPHRAKAHMNLSASYLLLGEFRQGWTHFEWRWRDAQIQLPHPWPTASLWNGREDPRGLDIFVHAEQGLGDTIQFCRYLPLLAARGARVSFLCADTLRPLLHSMAALGIELVGAGDQPSFDRHVPLLSLPLAMGTKLDSVPADVPYLRVPEDRVRTWTQRVAQSSKRRVGVAWSGRPAHVNDKRRSIAMREFQSLLHRMRRGNVECICVQKDISAPDRNVLDDLGIVCVDDALNDMADTAALLQNVDLLISVDTSVAHLAGALGRPVWILLPFVPDWRWMLGRSDSPWYPSATLIRQPTPGDWEAVFDEVERALVKWLAD